MDDVRVAPGRSVRLAVRLSDRDGARIDQALSDDPLVIEFGRDHLLGRADAALAGACVGDRVRVELPARDAFGERDESLVFEVLRSALPNAAEARVGTIYDAAPRPLMLVGLDGERARLDGNDPLAGRDLVVVMDVLDIA